MSRKLSYKKGASVNQALIMGGEGLMPGMGRGTGMLQIGVHFHLLLHSFSNLAGPIKSLRIASV